MKSLSACVFLYTYTSLSEKLSSRAAFIWISLTGTFRAKLPNMNICQP